MKENAKAMVLASFAADALSLGVHWIYDTGDIDRNLGRIEGLLKPLENSFHPTKDRGEFTHYGDQTLELLESIAENSSFDLNHFAQRWKGFFDNYSGYFDHATKETLANLSSQKDPATAASSSNDLGGAARIAPLVYRYRNNREALIGGSKAQTAMTHNSQNVIESAEFFAKVAWAVLRGDAPAKAVKNLQQEDFNRAPYAEWITKGMQTTQTDTRTAIAGFGQTCDAAAAFPCVIHLITRYENDLRGALVENAMAGGDSAARGLLTGMVLGAHLGVEAIPKSWLADMKHSQRINDLLDKLDSQLS